eukprot:364234-Chlamydomonas_euryale.AAC.22
MEPPQRPSALCNTLAHRPVAGPVSYVQTLNHKAPKSKPQTTRLPNPNLKPQGYQIQTTNHKVPKFQPLNHKAPKSKP